MLGTIPEINDVFFIFRRNNNFQKVFNDKIFKPYFLFIGRLEERKNITGIVESFEILKKKHKVPHKLILVGKFGFGAERIKSKISESDYRNDIILTGYVSDNEKSDLLKNAEIFLFPTFYEGFGLPALEAMACGRAVICSHTSSLPEVVDGAAILFDPYALDEIVRDAIEDARLRGAGRVVRLVPPLAVVDGGVTARVWRAGL